MTDKMQGKFLSIQEKGGLRNHLAQLGLDYDGFIAEVQDGIAVDRKVNKARLARKYGVGRDTITRWLDQLKTEQPTLFA